MTSTLPTSLNKLWSSATSKASPQPSWHPLNQCVFWSKMMKVPPPPGSLRPKRFSPEPQRTDKLKSLQPMNLSDLPKSEELNQPSKELNAKKLLSKLLVTILIPSTLLILVGYFQLM